MSLLRQKVVNNSLIAGNSMTNWRFEIWHSFRRSISENKKHFIYHKFKKYNYEH